MRRLCPTSTAATPRRDEDTLDSSQHWPAGWQAAALTSTLTCVLSCIYLQSCSHAFFAVIPRRLSLRLIQSGCKRSLDLDQRVQHAAQRAVGIGELARLLEVVGREHLGAARQPAHAFERSGEDLRLAAELGAVADRPCHRDRAADAAEMAHGARGIELLRRD